MAVIHLVLHFPRHSSCSYASLLYCMAIIGPIYDFMVMVLLLMVEILWQAKPPYVELDRASPTSSATITKLLVN